MPIPNLIHPVDVKIEQIDKPSTFYDEDAREPIQQAARTTVVILKGQVRWTGQFDKESTDAGIKENESGYVLFRTTDLSAQSITLQVNDRVAQIGGRDMDSYLTRLEWLGHYPEVNGPTLVKAYFADRQPSKQTRGV